MIFFEGWRHQQRQAALHSNFTECVIHVVAVATTFGVADADTRRNDVPAENVAILKFRMSKPSIANATSGNNYIIKPLKKY